MSVAKATAYILESATDDAIEFQGLIEKAAKLFKVRQIEIENNLDLLFMGKDTQVLNENIEKIISNNENYQLVIEDIIK